MSDIRFQVAIAAYVFIGAMGLSFGLMLFAFAWALVRPASCDTHPKGGDAKQGSVHG